LTIAIGHEFISCGAERVGGGQEHALHLEGMTSGLLRSIVQTWKAIRTFSYKGVEVQKWGAAGNFDVKFIAKMEPISLKWKHSLGYWGGTFQTKEYSSPEENVITQTNSRQAGACDLGT